VADEGNRERGVRAASPEAATNPQDDRAWAEHAYSQLVWFRNLPLREKILAIEGMAEVAERVSRHSPTA
jgi:hypothetical protein